MIKRFYLPALAGLLVVSVPASVQAAAGLHSGFFVGLAATATLPNYGYKNLSAVDTKKSAHGVLVRPELFAGYGELLSSNNLYVGFDAGLQLGGSSDQVSYYQSNPNITHHAKEKAVYYADVLPGFVMDNQGSDVLYGIFGVADASFNLDQQGGGSSNFSQTNSHFGYRVGLGYSMALASHFTVGLKYIFSNFGSIGYTNGANRYELNPKNNDVSLGVTYTFGGSGSTSGPFLGDG